jgi:histidinol-phosphate aminotransferase
MSHFFDDEKTLRISVGTTTENEKLITVLEKLSDEYETK